MALPHVALHVRRKPLALGTIALGLVAVVGFQGVGSPAQAAVSAASHSSPSVIALPAADTATDASPATPAAASTSATATATLASPPSAPHAPAARAHAAVPARHAVPAPASADVCSGPDWTVRRGQRALASLRDSGQRSGVTVSFLAGKAGYLGLTYPTRHHVDVFVRSCSAESATLLRHVVSHEMGHAYDAAHMTPALRDAYKAMRGIPPTTPWFGCSYCTDFNTPAGDFAETYSQWQRGSYDSRTQIAPMPGPAQLAAIAAAFFQG